MREDLLKEIRLVATTVENLEENWNSVICSTSGCPIQREVYRWLYVILGVADSFRLYLATNCLSVYRFFKRKIN